jgi:hypothetical protein
LSSIQAHIHTQISFILAFLSVHNLQHEQLVNRSYQIIIHCFELMEILGCSTFLKEVPPKFSTFSDFEGYCQMIDLINQNRGTLHDELTEIFQAW